LPFFYYHKTKALPWISAVSLAAGIVFNIILLPVLSIYGVCLAVFLTRVIQCSLAWYTGKKMGIIPEGAFNIRGKLFLCLLVLLAAAATAVIQIKTPASWQAWAYFPLAILYTIYIISYVTRKGWWQKLSLTR